MKMFKIASLLIVFIGSAIDTSGQGMSGSSRIEEDYKILPIPYINYNRSVGFQIGALPMVQFNPVSKDTLSPSSVAGWVSRSVTSLTGIIKRLKPLCFLMFIMIYGLLVRRSPNYHRGEDGSPGL